MKSRMIASLLAVLILTSGAASAASLGQLQHGDDAFNLTLPQDCKITRRPGKLDFEVFDVTCGGRPYAGIYAGNAPSTDIPRSRLLTTQFEWPSTIQVWTQKVPGHQRKADQIAASVRLRPLPGKRP
jgi:hypothetical protein